MLRLVFDNSFQNNPHGRYPELLNYFNLSGVPFSLIPLEQSIPSDYYTTSIYFFDFSLDYLSYLPPDVISRLRENKIKLLLLYSEADSPYDIQARLNTLAQQYNINPVNIFFVSGNSIADKLQNFIYFNECECLYYKETINDTLPNITSDIKEKKFTLLSRMVKNWRSDFIYNIWKDNLHVNAYVSHGAVKNPDPDEYPFNFTRFGDVTVITQDFWDSCPLKVDDIPVQQQINTAMSLMLNTNSYVNVVLESLLDCEGTGGVSLTEKTWKPIRNGQMFVILGCKGSLAHLRELGYKTFNEILDESYDNEPDVYNRWHMVLTLTKKIARMSIAELHELYLQSIPILQHNQRHFTESIALRTSQLSIKLQP